MFLFAVLQIVHLAVHFGDSFGYPTELPTSFVFHRRSPSVDSNGTGSCSILRHRSVNEKHLQAGQNLYTLQCHKLHVATSQVVFKVSACHLSTTSICCSALQTRFRSIGLYWYFKKLETARAASKASQTGRSERGIELPSQR